MLRWFEHRQIYFPTRAHDIQPGVLTRPFEDVSLQTPDGIRLHAWYFPATTDSPRRKRVVLVCHGNGGNISHRLPLAGSLLATGVSVLLFDYRGYGLSEGRPSEAGTYQDVFTAYEWLRMRDHLPRDILVLGESLGGAIASYLAVHQPVGALILVGAFTSIPDIGSELYPWLPVRRLVRTHYDTRAYLQQVQVPVLILHSRQDDLVRFHHAEANYAAARPPKWLRELQGTHNESLADVERIRAAIEELLRKLETDV
ncbi:MAG: alpha/beta hydrolase [Verrucomicrobiota bacterium]|nr:alpha/beta hydrolase [Limisphaera sp.]MDW8380521.1 alpha/beta hydrolase [Verrucomicrobiota bacterium]